MQEILIHDIPHEWTYPWPLRGTTCHLFFEMLINAQNSIRLKGFKKDLWVYRDHLFQDFVWHTVYSWTRVGFHLWKQESLDVFDSIGIVEAEIFLLVNNLLVNILTARPHGSFSTSPIEPFQHWNRLFFETDCTRQYTQSRFSPPAYRPARAAATPYYSRPPPHHAPIGIKGRPESRERAVRPGRRAGSHRSIALDERPGDAYPGGYSHRKVSPAPSDYLVQPDRALGNGRSHGQLSVRAGT